MQVNHIAFLYESFPMLMLTAMCLEQVSSLTSQDVEQKVCSPVSHIWALAGYIEIDQLFDMSKKHQGTCLSLSITVNLLEVQTGKIFACFRMALKLLLTYQDKSSVQH